MPFWNGEKMWAAQVCVTVNSLVQCTSESLPFHVVRSILCGRTFLSDYLLFLILNAVYFYYVKMSYSPAAKWTRWNVTTFAGIGVLDFLHNGAIAVSLHLTYLCPLLSSPSFLHSCGLT